MQVFKNKTFKRIVSFVVLVAMIVGAYFLLTDIMSDTTYRTYFEKDLKEIEENGEDVDIFFVGASRMYRSFVPEVFEEKMSLSNVLVGSTATQPICGSYYYIRQIIKDIHPKKIILDVTWDRLLNEKQAQACLLVYDRLSGMNKAEYALNCFDKDSRRFLLGPCRYKDNIIMIDEIAKEKKEMANYSFDEATLDGEMYKEKGFVYSSYSLETGTVPYRSDDNYVYSDAMILPENKDYLDKCVEICKENGIDFEIVSAPCSDTYMYYVDGYDDAVSWYNNYAKEKGINYINLNYLRGREELLPDEYFGDIVHTNGKGAYAISDIYADLLIKEEAGEDISSYFYENLDELKKDVHRIVSLETKLEFSTQPNEDGSVDANVELDSLHNDDAKAFYQIELKRYDSEEPEVLSEWSEKESLTIHLPSYGGYQIIVRAKSQYDGDKEAKMVYSY